LKACKPSTRTTFDYDVVSWIMSRKGLQTFLMQKRFEGINMREISGKTNEMIFLIVIDSLFVIEFLSF